MGKWRKTILKVLVDFDGTLAPMAWPQKPGAPYPCVRAALQKIRDAGLEIVIFTSRAWLGWIEQEGSEFFERQYAEMVDWLREHEIPYDRITNLKEPALFLVDDRAILLTSTAGERGAWADVAYTVLSEVKRPTYVPQGDPEKAYGRDE